MQEMSTNALSCCCLYNPNVAWVCSVLFWFRETPQEDWL